MGNEGWVSSRNKGWITEQKGSRGNEGLKNRGKSKRI